MTPWRPIHVSNTKTFQIPAWGAALDIHRCKPKSAQTSKPIRLIKPITVTYHSHWFLLGGLRLAYRPSDALNEYNVLIGQSVLEGCAIQATECERGWATNVATGAI